MQILALAIAYWQNLLTYVRGFSELRSMRYRDGWSFWNYLPVYILDVGPNVLTGGAPWQTLSATFQMHRGSWLWDKILDVIEIFDKRHGLDAVTHAELFVNELPGNARLGITALWGLILWMI